MGSAVSRYYGCRPTVIGGGLTAAVGLATASQATALWHLYTCMALVGKFDKYKINGVSEEVYFV